MKTLNPYQNYCPYDVGDVLVTFSDALPSNRWPGTTWIAVQNYLRGADDSHKAGTEEGSDSYRLEIGNIPHLGTAIEWKTDAGDDALFDRTNPVVNGWTSKWIGSGNYPYNTPIPLSPKTTVVYMWKRTA